jgi:hypothetical protein
MDFPVEILFVLFFLLASILDAVGRSRKKKQRMEDMERAEEEGGEGSMGRARSSRTPGERSAATSAPAPRMKPRPTVSSPRPTSTPRETADSMIPPDLWEILTGTPAPSRPRGPVGTPMETSRDAESMETEPVGRGSLEVEPSRPISIEAESLERDAPERDAFARERMEAPAPDRLGRFGLPELRIPAGKAPSTLARSLPEEGGRLVASAVWVPTETRRRGASYYGRLLREGKTADLRTAIVLTEVLGPPVALRDVESSSPTSPRGPFS